VYLYCLYFNAWRSKSRRERERERGGGGRLRK
jgi:hypothetical protein